MTPEDKRIAMQYAIAALSIAIAMGPAVAVAGSVSVSTSSSQSVSQSVTVTVTVSKYQRQSVTVSRDWRDYRWFGRSGRSIGRHRQLIGRRKHWSQRPPRRRKRRAVGRRSLTLNGEQHCCHDGQTCPGWRRSTIHHSATCPLPFRQERSRIGRDGLLRDTRHPGCSCSRLP